MKIDAMTAGAVGFAAFAAWYVLRKPATNAGTGQNVAVTTAAAQRAQVGAATSQNTDYLYSLFGLGTAPNLASMGGGQGLVV